MDLPIFHMVMTLEGRMKELFQRENKYSQAIRDQFLFYLDNVTVKYPQVKALSEVTLKISPGEILFVTGKSGAGKSTLLNLIAGDIKPNSGKVLANHGRTLNMAQVFQDLKLFEHETIENNLWYSYNPSLYKNKNDFYNDLLELAKVLGFSNKLDLKVEKANGGLKAKVAMTRALLSKPNILIADEPTAALDKESAIKLFDVLNFYNVKRKLTIVWASHNRELVKQFPGKIVHLEKGKLIYSGHACFI